MKLMIYLLPAIMACIGSTAVAVDDPDVDHKPTEQSEQQVNAKKASSNRKKIAETIRVGTPSIGPENAAVNILAFTETGPMSEKTLTSINHVLSQYPNKVRIVFQITDDSKPDALIWAADKQGKFWDVYEAVMTNHDNLDVNEEFAQQFGLDFDRLTTAMKSSEFSEQVKQNQEKMNELQVQELPTFFVNTQRHIGAAGLSRVVFEHLTFTRRERMMTR